MNGEQLERLASYALEYNVAREEERRASARKEFWGEKIEELFKKAGEHLPVNCGQYTVEIVAAFRESIPVKLAKQVLNAAQLEQVLQTSVSSYPKVSLNKGGSR